VFVDDIFDPKSEALINGFNSEELKSLAELYGRMCVVAGAIEEQGCETVSELQKTWRVAFAYALLQEFGDST